MKLLMTALVASCLLLLSTPVGSQSDGGRVRGRFHSGDGLGVVRSLEIKGGDRFSYLLETHLGRVHDAEGVVEVVEGRLWFSVASGDHLGPNSRLRGWWVPVHWGPRLYLIGEEEMLDFINSVNHGWEPRHSAAGLYLLRHGDSDRPVTGAPSIPSEWRDYLLRQPVTGRITSVADARHAEIDLGRRHGLRVGMVLWAELTPTAMFPAEVTRVTPNTSEVMVESTYRQSFVVGQRVRSRDRP